MRACDWQTAVSSSSSHYAEKFQRISHNNHVLIICILSCPPRFVKWFIQKIKYNILSICAAGTGPPVESKILSGRRYESPFSVEELLNLVIPKKQSADMDMDPCKAPAFIGKWWSNTENIFCTKSWLSNKRKYCILFKVKLIVFAYSRERKSSECKTNN